MHLPNQKTEAFYFSDRLVLAAVDPLLNVPFLQELAACLDKML